MLKISTKKILKVQKFENREFFGMFRIILFSEMESSKIILIIQQTDVTKLLLYYGS
jgi:hypothetical protein